MLVLETAGCRPSTTIVPVEPDGRTEVECPPPTVITAKAPPGSADDREPPQIVSAHFNGSERVVLTFSEGLEVPKQVNPRQFRLSEAYSTIDYAGAYASAYYYDLAARYGDELPLLFVEIEQTEPEQLVLTLNRGIPLPICENLRVAQEDTAAAAAIPEGNKIRRGLFLHYTKRGSVGLRDLAGNTLEDFGGEWALHFGARDKRLTGHQPLVRFDLLIELECPSGSNFIGPPGPS